MKNYFLRKTYIISILIITVVALFIQACKSTEVATTTPLVSAAVNAPDPDSLKIKITPGNSRISQNGSSEFFTGKVKVDSLFQPNVPSRTAGAYVTFSPGARSAWHTHPLGQILIVTEGNGLVQQWGEPIREIKKGDVIWTPPDQKHWHGATANSSMTHIAIQEQFNGKTVNWMEKVSDEQYSATVQKEK